MKLARTQPPVGYRIALGTLTASAVRALVQKGERTAFESDIARRFAATEAFSVSSGKAALTLILLALHKLSGRRKVIIPAYTCYSVPSAIVKAGLEVVPCDIARDSFEYDFQRLAPMLQPDVLCVLSVHLLGIPSDTPRLNGLCRDKGIFVVEDAAQAFGGQSGGTLLGTQGDVGFFSFGRGKNVTCGSGGAIVTGSEEIARALRSVTAGLSSQSLTQGVSTFVTLLLLRWFITPGLYWFPAGLPFLKLGETIFHEQFPMQWLSDFQAYLLRNWTADLERLEAVRRRHAAYYSTHIEGASAFRDDVPYLRFPVFLPAGLRKEHLLVERGGIALGIGTLYPASVAQIPQLAHRLGGLRFPEAERTAASLVTLPTHPLVSDDDRSRIAALVNDVVMEDGPSRRVRLDGTVTEVTAHS